MSVSRMIDNLGMGRHNRNCNLQVTTVWPLFHAYSYRRYTSTKMKMNPIRSSPEGRGLTEVR